MYMSDKNSEFLEKKKMKRKSACCILSVLALVFVAEWRADACTNIIISSGASKDGSCLVSYAADSHSLYGELYFRPAADYAPGTMLKIYDWDTGRYLGEIAQAEHTFKTVGNMNEHQLIITETTYGGREELLDRRGIIDYGSLIYITLQRAKTAREAIQIIVDLANEYGYASEGETFSIADKNEAWVMDLIGKGMNIRNGVNVDKGIVWVARRVPDGYICAHANQARIGKFPLNDPENCLYAKDVISFARKKGYFQGEDEDFDFAKAYAPWDFETTRACDARVWSAYNLLCNGWFTYTEESGRILTKDAYTYVDYALGYDLENRIPLFVKPNHKVGVKDLANAMRDHFEGTPMDMTQDIGAGGNGLPYRWRPMRFSSDGKRYLNERAIATQQTGFWMVGQARPYLPDVIGGVLWFGTDDAATSYLTPIYTNVNSVPNCFREGNGDLLHYSATASFWINNRVANACYKMYDQMAPYVRERVDDFENEVQLRLTHNDEEALKLYNKIAFKAQEQYEKNGKVKNDYFVSLRRQLTRFSTETAQNQFQAWVKLEETLLVKFVDGNVKAQDRDGNFLHTEHSTKMPAKMKHPGYSDKWKAAVAADHGEVLVIPEKKNEDE